MVQAKILILCGPTATGKTAAAIELAEKWGLEIISADSGQVYRGMDIGTAKPTAEEQGKVRFHLIDILDPIETFSAADFRERALEAIRDIESRGKRAMVVGGTGLYLKALEEGLFEGPSRDPAIRAELERRIGLEGVESLHRELQAIDPEAAKTIPPHNRQRIIRALEVYRITGQPISKFWAEHQAQAAPTRFVKIGLNLSREEIYRRIDERVDRMFAAGLVDEVRTLVEKWGRDAPGLRIIGYKETVAGTISLIKQKTRQYAKRQQTWFKKDRLIRWVADWREAIEQFPGIADR